MYRRPREAPISSELYQEILSGRTTRERKLAVCGGSAGIIAAERAELVILLAEDSDEMVRERAENAVPQLPLPSIVEALQGDAPAAQLFRYCGRHLLDQPTVAAAMARHWRCPPEYLVAAAKRLSTSSVQELMEDLDRLSASPNLVGALLHSASLTADQRDQLQELMKDDPAGEEAFAEAVKLDIDPEQRVTLLQRLSRMRVVERVQLGIKGNREERMALIRDPCKVVQRAVLQSSRITDREVETFASMASLTEDVLRIIANSRKFRKNYAVLRNLINNPKTPLDISLHLLPNIAAQDIKGLCQNKNIPETLRTSAVRLQRQRTVARSE